MHYRRQKKIIFNKSSKGYRHLLSERFLGFWILLPEIRFFVGKIITSSSLNFFGDKIVLITQQSEIFIFMAMDTTKRRF